MDRRVALGLSLLALIFSGCNGASNDAVNRVGQDGNKGFMVKTLQRGIWTRKYGLFVPLSYHPGTTQKYPVIIFLHGIGEGAGLGEGNQNNMKVGIGPAIARKAEKFEFIVIFPQSGGTWSPDSDYASDIFTALANTCREYPVDNDRIALTGLSTGGAGTWAIGARYSDQFSALVPMGSNGSNQSDAPRLTHVAVRAYCSMFGDVFAGWNDHGMVNRIKSIDPNANAQFISTPTLGHDCWENVYGGDELYDWLKRQHRTSSVAAVPVQAAPPVIQASVVTPPPALPAPSRASTSYVTPSPEVVAPVSRSRPVTPRFDVPNRVAPSMPPAYDSPKFLAPPESSVPPPAPRKSPPSSINTPW